MNRFNEFIRERRLLYNVSLLLPPQRQKCRSLGARYRVDLNTGFRSTEFPKML